jgi:hypothetical protein
MCETMRSVHITGLDVQIGFQRRQLCAWCGHTLHEDDLSTMRWALREDGSDPGPPKMWPVGRLLVIDGIAKYILKEDGDQILPDECCANLVSDIEKHLNHGGD